MSYGEFPVDRIVGCNFDGGPPPNCHDNPDQFPQIVSFPRVGNRFGFGVERTSTEDHSSSGFGLGDHTNFTVEAIGDYLGPPFVGSFNTVGFNGPDTMLQGGDYGGLTNPYTDGDGNLIASTLDLTGLWSMITFGMQVSATQISFTTPALDGSATTTFDPTYPGPVAATFENWHVPMASGFACMQHGPVPQFPPIVGPDGRPILVYPTPRYFVDTYVVDTIRFQLDWVCGTPDPGFMGVETLGLSLVHPFSVQQFGGFQSSGYPNGGTGLVSGGSIDFTYNFRYQDWLNRELNSNLTLGHPFFYDADSAEDLSLGGPMLCYIVLGNGDTGFGHVTFPPTALTGANEFFSPLRGLGDSFTWKITTTVKPASLTLTPIDGVSFS